MTEQSSTSSLDTPDIKGWQKVAEEMQDWPPALQEHARRNLEERGINEISPEHHQTHIEIARPSVPNIDDLPVEEQDLIGEIVEIGNEAIQSTELKEEQEYEALNQQEFHNAFNSYVRDRALGWHTHDKGAPGVDWIQARSKYPKKATQDQIEAEMRDIASNYGLLERIESPIEQPEKPAMSVCVPVAILREDPDGIVSLVEMIKRQQDDFDKPVELLLWTNAKFSESSEDEVRENAKIAYENLKAQIADYANDGNLQIRTALQLIPEAKFSMSKLRGDYMDALVSEAKQRGYGFDHPVMWLDADTTRIKQGSLRAIADEVTSLRSVFVHTNLNYSFDWVKDTPLSKADDATRAFVANEVARRTELRGYKSNPDTFSAAKNNEYFEESGASFAIGTYLNTGGMNELDPVNETAGLILHALSLMSRPDRNTGIPATLYYKKTGGRPHAHGGYYPEDRQPLKRHIPTAVVFTSGRRYYDGLKRSGRLPAKRGDAIPGDNGEYKLGSDMSQEEQSVPIDTTNILSNSNVGFSRDKIDTSNLRGRILEKYLGDLHRQQFQERERDIADHAR